MDNTVALLEIAAMAYLARIIFAVSNEKYIALRYCILRNVFIFFCPLGHI